MPAKAGLVEKRSRLDLVVVACTLIFPWSLFSLLCWFLSFTLHFKQAALCWFVVGSVGFAIGFGGPMSLKVLQARRASHHRVALVKFLFISSLGNWLLGSAAGTYNYWENMQPYYLSASLNSYLAVDVTKQHGQQLMDAGRILFAANSSLDKARSAGYRSAGRVFCVAPVVPNEGKLASYDFWAAGIDCCSGVEPDFHCGDKGANGGLRILDRSQSMYIQALQQAKAAYGISASYPLFITWTQDPFAAVHAHQDAGFRFYALWSLMAFAIQFFGTVVVVVALSKDSR